MAYFESKDNRLVVYEACQIIKHGLDLLAAPATLQYSFRLS